MRFFKFAIPLVFLAILCFPVFSSAQENQNDKARKLLREALTKEANTSYMFVSEMGEGKTRNTIKFYQKVNPDGTVWSRFEYTSGSGDTDIVLRIPSGKYTIFNGHISKDDAHELKRYELSELDKHSPSYFLSEETVKGTPCYKVTRVIKITPDVIADRKRLLSRDLVKRNGESFDYSAVIQARIDYYIGKEDNFIHGRRCFNKSGVLLPSGELLIDRLELNPVFSDDLFALPGKPSEGVLKPALVK